MKKIKVPQYRSRMLKQPVAVFLKKDVAERAAAVEALRKEVVLRSIRFRTRGLYSHGLEALERKLGNAGFDLMNPLFLPVTQELGADIINRKNQSLTLLQAFTLYREFLDPVETKTNSVAGIQAVNKAQDRLIFGTNGKGRPLGTVGDSEERRQWWALIDAIRGSDIVKTSDPYFYRSSTYLEIWERFRAGKLNVETVGAEIQKFFDKRYQEQNFMPPAQQSAGEEVEVNGSREYFSREVYSMFERRGLL